MYQSVINFCPNGMVPRKTDNQNVPISAAEIVEQVHEAFEMGITIAHLHSRDENENPDWKPDSYIPIVEGVKKYCPGLVICLTTSGRDVQEFEKRAAVLDLKPDMASLTLGSLNFLKQASVNAPDMIVALFEKMQSWQILPEFECFSIGMINYGKYLKNKYKINTPAYWNLLFGNINGLQCELLDMGTALSKIDERDIVAIAGLGNAQLPATYYAIATGTGIRIGLEDNLFFDQKKNIPATNRSLLKRVHQLLEIHEREWMKPDEFRKITGVKNCI